MGVVPHMQPKRIRIRYDALRPFGPVLTSLMKALHEGEPDLRRLSDLISCDPALAAQVLRMVNSPLFARRSEITSLVLGLSHLGLDRLYALVLTSSLRGLLAPVARLPLARLCWRHSLATALLCADLSVESFSDMTEEYTAGLLHDIGRLVLLASAPAEYSDLVSKLPFEECSEAEAALFGLTHEQAGVEVMRRFGFPLPLIAMAAHHHTDPAELVGRNPSAALVASCCRMASQSGFSLRSPLPATECGCEEMEDDDLCLYIRERVRELELSLAA